MLQHNFKEVCLSRYQTTFQDSFSEQIWETTYKDYKDQTIDDSLFRVASAIASVESTEKLKEEWTEKFYDLLSGFKGVAGGRILSNAGTDWKGTTLANCFVGSKGNYDIDSLEGILNDLRNQSFTLKSEGGWGFNFSYIRPRGSFIHGIGVESPGAVKYMELFDKSSEIITSGSGKVSKNKKAKGKIRKGAMMSILDISHPDIVEFITAKQQPGRLTKFNMSVNCSDAFMSRVNRIRELDKLLNINTGGLGCIDAVDSCRLQEERTSLDKWDLIFPETTHPEYKSKWTGDIKAWIDADYPIKIYDTISVTRLWDLIMESTYNRAEPGIIFLDRANHYNPLNYAETIVACNPSMPAGTLIHTKGGIFPIDQLEGKSFLVKSRDGIWADAECRLSGENEELLELSFGANKTIRSTKQHRWPVYDARMNRIYKEYAENLKPGDMIPLNRNERIGIQGDLTLTRDQGFLVGYLQGDGWVTKKDESYSTPNSYNVGFTFGSHEQDMADKIISILNTLKSHPSSIKHRESTGEIYIQSSSNELIDFLLNKCGFFVDKTQLPSKLWTSNDDFIEGFVDGLLSADGHLVQSGNSRKLVLTTSKFQVAQEFAKLLSFAGIFTNIWHITTESKHVTWPNGKTYDRDDYHRWEVAINGNAMINFYNVFDISHSAKREKLEQLVQYILSNVRSHHSSKFVVLKSITQLSERARVWDISVYHNEHVFPTEWCYTGNCGEQMLAPGGICCLGTLNLTQFVNDNTDGFDLNKLSKYVKILVRFLDNVNTYSEAPLPEYKESMTKKRRIGCGVMGWGSSLLMMKIPFGSATAATIRESLMQCYATAAYEASIDLAQERGMFKYCDPIKHSKSVFIQSLNLSSEYMEKLKTTGIRNSSLLSQQPNGNSSILSNIVSGGIEPIFMPEYIRTVIVGTLPDHIAEVTPRWFEGAWHETEMFKFASEGDDQLLKGVDQYGITYKIDKNRGLTKEVLCEDYGVRFLKQRGEWDSSADWAKTTTELTVENHVSDLKGFARYTDSACSKTVNLPFEYPYEDFKNLYLDVYNTGYIKGFTTYRSGTLMTVLAAKDEKTAGDFDEEIILHEVKLPASQPATMKTLRGENRKWYVTITWNEDQTRPMALFVHTNSSEKNITTTSAVDHLLGLAKRKGIPEQHINETLCKISNDNNTTKIARMISLNLRHGVLLKNIVSALDQVEEITVVSFLFQIKKFLASFIKDGEVVDGETCSECGSHNVVYQEGCKICLNCSNSKCS